MVIVIAAVEDVLNFKNYVMHMNVLIHNNSYQLSELGLVIMLTLHIRKQRLSHFGSNCGVRN